MKIKLIALDLDGTLLNSCGYVTNETIMAITTAIEKGVEVVLATGRSVGLICDNLRDIKEIKYVIASNGAAVIDLRENKVIFSEYISVEVLKKIIEIIEKFPIVVEFYSNGYIYIDEDIIVNTSKYGISNETIKFISNNHKLVKNIFPLIREGNNVEWLNSIEKVNIPFLKEDMKNELFNSLLLIRNKVKVTSSVIDNIEINTINTNKGNALKKLIEIIGINLKETAAIGDNNNDIEMIEEVGIGIVMGNASDDIKIKADLITLSNDEGGAALAIFKILSDYL